MRSVKGLFWAAFAVFAACALGVGWREATEGPWTLGRLLVWAAFLGFLSYTVYCSSREDLVASVRRISQLHWGRQVGADLYLGLCLALFVMYLHGGLLTVLLWLLPVLAFANLATLLYFAIHFDAIVARFLA
jgi:hypothetical protein